LSRRRRRFAPKRVDQSVARDGVAALEDEQGKQRALLRAAQVERTLVGLRLERPEDAELDPSSVFDPWNVTRGVSRE
jgi:hypothetical protein